MVEVLNWRPWEPTGPCRAPRTTPRSLPGVLNCASIISYQFGYIWEAKSTASLVTKKAGKCNVAKRGHGCPCGQQSMDETYGYCAQRKKTSRFWWYNNCWTGTTCCRSKRSCIKSGLTSPIEAAQAMNISIDKSDGNTLLLLELIYEHHANLFQQCVNKVVEDNKNSLNEAIAYIDRCVEKEQEL